MTPDTKNRIQTLIDTHRVLLFMKGTAAFPQCGFSYQVANILQQAGTEFEDINVLEDETLRQGIKAFTNWPTIPQLYINGEFVGGCDIIKELHETGELAKLLSEKKEAADSTT